MSTSSASTWSCVISSVYFSLALLSLGNAPIATVQAEDFLRLDSAIPYPATAEADFITVLAWQFNGGLTSGH